MLKNAEGMAHGKKEKEKKGMTRGGAQYQEKKQEGRRRKRRKPKGTMSTRNRDGTRFSYSRPSRYCIPFRLTHLFFFLVFVLPFFI